MREKIKRRFGGARLVPPTTIDPPVPKPIPAPRSKNFQGKTKVLLDTMDKIAGRTLTAYESELIITIVDAIIAEKEKAEDE